MQMPTIRAMSKKRETAARARWKENPSQEYWADVVKAMAASNFCGGLSTHFVADFDFLCKPDTGMKVLEGKYKNRS